MDVVDLRKFYDSALGHAVQNQLNRQLAGLTQARSGQTVLGLGYASPFLVHQAPEVLQLSFMLARQGVIHWPPTGANRSALVDGHDLPLLESTVDLALVVHGLEHADTPLDMLQEIWRVMAPQGRVILVLPNRRGLWAASEATPFGFGQPFSSGQIGGLLKEAKFTVTQWRRALYLPPLQHGSLLRAARAFDIVGARIAQRFAGVMIVEAMKEVYAFSSGKRARRLNLRFRPVLLPSPQPLRRDGE